MPLKAGVVQFSPLYGRVAENLERLEALVSAAVAQGAGLLVLPEMAWTGYLWASPTTIGPYAETAGHGWGQDRVSQWARRWGISIVFGFPERDGQRLYNSQGVATSTGDLGTVYRKTHLFEADEWWALPGNSGYLQWATPWGRVGSGICMDLNYQDFVDYHIHARTDVLAFSTNWLDQGFDVVPYWVDCLGGAHGAGFNGVALFANRGGAEFGVSYRGQSTIFIGGRPVATTPGKEDAVLVADIPFE